VEIFHEKPYPEYMTLMEEGDITLDSYPYGGYGKHDRLNIFEKAVCIL